jgi:hypothetical protein
LDGEKVAALKRKRPVRYYPTGPIQPVNEILN